MAKNGHLSNFFSGNIGHENVFYDILERKNAFLGYKKGSSKSQKIDIFSFPKGLTDGFGPKWPFFQLFLLGNIDQKNVFYYVLKRKNAFLSYKKKKFKKSKNWKISKEINPWFWSKNGHFSSFFFLRQYRPGHSLLWYSITTKKTFLSYKNKKFKESKNGHFSKGVNW